MDSGQEISKVCSSRSSMSNKKEVTLQSSREPNIDGKNEMSIPNCF